MHALPLTYNKDMQEDKEHLFDAVDTLELCLGAARGMIAGATFDRERMAAAASDELIAATDLADLLVRRGMPFREAHGIVAGLVRDGGRAAGHRCARLAAAEPSAPRRGELLEQRRGWSPRSPRAGRRWRACASSSRRRARRSPLRRRERAARAFFARPVVEVARDLVGCVVAPRRPRRA